MLYIALTSFVMNKENYVEEDIKKGQILPSDFVSENIITDLINAGYIKVFDGLITITENGDYEVEDYEVARVNVEGTPEEVDTLIDTINGEVI
jgi:hypothetical protein